jgi:lipid-binding SYLF domain-containing protein
MKRIKPILAGFVLALVTLFTTATASADLVSDSRRALQQLVAQNPAASKAKSKASAILVFPDVVKAGFIVGAQGDQGILFIHGHHFRSTRFDGRPWAPRVQDHEDRLIEI